MEENGGAGLAMAGSAMENLRLNRFGKVDGRLAHLRPVPDDFHEVAPTLFRHALARHYKANCCTIDRWTRDTGVTLPVFKRPIQHPVPGDFAEKVGTMHLMALHRHYGVSYKTIHRWISETGSAPGAPPIQPQPPRPILRAIPDDFAMIAPGKNRSQLIAHYHVSQAVLVRWIAESGVSPRPNPRTYRYGQPRSIGPTVDASEEAQAAAYLRRRVSNVFRCDILPERERRDLPNKGKGMWVVGRRGAVPAAELVTLAKARGFDPQAWARI